MRYYEFMFHADAEEIKEKAKVEFIYYRSQKPYQAMNEYLYRNMKNGLTFFVYREEDDRVRAAFSFDETTYTLMQAYDYMIERLKDDFHITQVQKTPEEITTHQFLDYMLEGNRREYVTNRGQVVDESNLWIYPFSSYHKSNNTEEDEIRFEFKDRIVSDKICDRSVIYDPAFLAELTNIEEHQSQETFQGNPVHYVISGRSMEAAYDMAERLMVSLLRAGRINSRRMEIITSIHPDAYVRNRMEELIRNARGGVVVFDLSEQFGHEPTEYTMTAKCIERLLKQYRSECLFIFTYNMNKPGFSYYLLPQLDNYVISKRLREGRGDRRAAVRYMKSLIKDSEFAAYAGQAGEYMKQYPGREFTQTDVLDAYEKFDSWCLNKNILKAYSCETSEEFLLDRDESEVSAYERLQKLIGLDIVKKQIETILASDIVEKERKRRLGRDYEAGSMHMIFSGNPGTAKTTVAKLFAGIAKEKELLKSGICVVKGGMDLDGMGCVIAIREAFMAAKGGVLFIDEAYSMGSQTAVTTLIQEMENHRDEVIVVLAGYDEKMKQFLELNEGLKSRIPHWVEFPDYSAEELTEIFKYMASERGFTVDEDAVKAARYIFEKVRNNDNFGNGRYARNLLDRAAQNQASRLMTKCEKKATTVRDRDHGAEEGSVTENEVSLTEQKSFAEISKVSKVALFKIKKEDICALEDGLQEKRPEGVAEKELADMVGLTHVKEVLRKAIAYFKLNKRCLDRGIRRDKASMHMVFTGNPGTAKTTVARLLAEILKDEKVLSTGSFVEVGRADLVGDHVGSTAPLVKKRFKEAQGGVLFIDEAYSLCDNITNGYGDEAINTLVQEMENHRDNVIVVFAGYPKPMQQFLDRNPGMLSRIAFQIEFDDYSTDELCEITKLMLEKKQMTVTDAAMEKLRDLYDKAREEEDYGNGRFVRKTLEEAEMNLAERIIAAGETDLTEELITTIEACDIPEPSFDKKDTGVPFGFAR